MRNMLSDQEELNDQYLNVIKLANDYFIGKFKNGCDYQKNEERVDNDRGLLRLSSSVLNCNSSLNLQHCFEGDANKSNDLLIQNLSDFILFIKEFKYQECVDKNDFAFGNILKEFFQSMCEKLFPKNYVKIKIFNFLNLNEKEKLIMNSNFNSKIDIQLQIKIQNFEIFQIINILLISTYLLEFKMFEDVLSLTSKCEEFIFSKKISFNLIHKNTSSNEINFDCDDLLQYLRYKLLRIYLLALEKTKEAPKKLTNIFKAYRTSTIDKDDMVSAVLINFLTRQFMLNKSYQQAQIFLSKISLDIDYNVNNKKHNNNVYGQIIKQKIRLYYNLSFINTIQGEYQIAIKHSEMALESLLSISNKCNSKRYMQRFGTIFVKIFVIYIILQLVNANEHFLSLDIESNCKLIKAIENILKEFPLAKNHDDGGDNRTLIMLLRKYLTSGLNAHDYNNNIKRRSNDSSNSSGHLLPYLFLFSSVVNGRIHTFLKILDKYKEIFANDGLYLVVSRLKRTAIFYGLKKLNIKYENATISLQKVIQDLEIYCDEECKGKCFVNVIAKNIKDKVINAKIIKVNDEEDKEETIVYIQDKSLDKILIKFSNKPENIFHRVNLSTNLKNSNKNIFSDISRNNSICFSTDNSIDNSL